MYNNLYCGLLDVGSEIPHSCSPKMLECLGRCIPWRFVCDHVDDCEDRSDELGCGEY